MKTWRNVEFESLFPKKSKRIIGMSFPRQDKTLGLEPSILNVLPPGENVEYDPENKDYNDAEVFLYLCSVYISGLDEFNAWKERHDKKKIVVGGYHPTTFPEDFPDVLRVVQGPCDDLWGTIVEKGDKRILPGIMTYESTPRRDLYDYRVFNQQIIPDKQFSDSVMSISTSMGCPIRPPCDFCCTPMMCPRLESKPLDALERELKEMVAISEGNVPGFKDKLHFLFIRDENFTAQKDWPKRLELIHRYFPTTKVYLFGSANTITEKTAKTLAQYGVYMVCLGLEDVTVDYGKNSHLDEVVARLKRYGIYTYLSFIVDPLKVVGKEAGQKFYDLLMKRLFELKPDMICGNFLMPFRGTKLWDSYYHFVDRADYPLYTSKEPFLIRNEVVREKMRFFLFWYQWLYFTSEEYKAVRHFECGDTLHLRFVELYKEFEPRYRRLWNVRP